MITSRLYALLIATLLGLAIAPATQAAEILVSAAASLTNVFQDIGKRYEQKYPSEKLIFNFAASNALLTQIQQGAPADVFASADQSIMDRARDSKLLIDGSRFDFTANTLVLVVSSSSNAMPKSLSDLTDTRFKRIAIGTRATVPAGRYAVEAVEKEKLNERLSSKWIFGESVRQVLSYVARDEVDAGFVYSTDAAVQKDKVRIAFVVPTKTRITYPIALLNTGKHTAGGKGFIEFLKTPEAREILNQAGFAKP